MAKLFGYSMLGSTAIAAGVVLTGIEVYGAVGYLLEQAQPSYLVLGGAIVTMVAAFLIPLGERCFRDGRYLLAAMLFAALVPALSIVVTAAIERTGGARDKITGDHQAKSAVIQLKKDAVEDAKADLDKLQAAEDRECNTAKPGADPRGPRCRSAEKRSEEGRTRLIAARGELAGAGVASKDPMVARIVAVLPGVTEGQVALFQPLILPVTISMLGILLIAAGARPPKRPKVQTRKGRRKRKVRAKVRKPQPPESRSNVVALRRRV